MRSPARSNVEHQPEGLPQSSETSALQMGQNDPIWTSEPTHDSSLKAFAEIAALKTSQSSKPATGPKVIVDTVLSTVPGTDIDTEVCPFPYPFMSSKILFLIIRRPTHPEQAQFDRLMIDIGEPIQELQFRLPPNHRSAPAITIEYLSVVNIPRRMTNLRESIRSLASQASSLHLKNSFWSFSSGESGTVKSKKLLR